MITGEPAAIAVTTPDDEPTVANAVLLLVHVPPPELLNVEAKPTHALAVPLIADGRGFTVATLVAIQPVPKV